MPTDLPIEDVPDLDHLPIEDTLGFEDLEARRIAARNFAPKLPGSWKPGLALQIEIERFIELYGLDRCALLTLLFAHPSCRRPITPAEAQVIFKRAARRILPDIFTAYIAVLDFHRSGNVHLHVLVALPFNFRDGWNFDLDQEHRDLQRKVKEEGRRMTRAELGTCRRTCRRLCQRMTTNLRALMVFIRLRSVLPAIGFPSAYPFELKPIRNPVGLARYLAGRYRESNARRDLRPPHSRCVRYSTKYPRCVDKEMHFSPVGPGARLYRQKKAVVGAAFGIHDIGGMIDRFGVGWEHDFRDILHPVNPRDADGFFSDQRVRLRERAEFHNRSIVAPSTVMDDLARAAERRRAIETNASVPARDESGEAPAEPPSSRDPAGSIVPRLATEPKGVGVGRALAPHHHPGSQPGNMTTALRSGALKDGERDNEEQPPFAPVQPPPLLI